MISTDAKCHTEIKSRIVTGEETFSKRKELLRKTRQESEETDDKNQCYMEFHAVWITDIGYDK